MLFRKTFQLCERDGASIGLCGVGGQVSVIRVLLSEAGAGVYVFMRISVIFYL